MRIGIELKVDVRKIDKTRLYKGEKGTYLTMTAFVDLDNQDQYGNNGMITHAKLEGEDRAPILGNSKVFWSDGQQQQQQRPAPRQQPQHPQQQPRPMVPPNRQGVQQGQQMQQPQGQAQGFDDFDDDIPFN